MGGVDANIRRDFQAQANLFVTHTYNEIVFNAEAEEYRNEASRYTQGGELEIQAVWGPRRAQLSYAFNHGEKGQGSGAPLYPRHQVDLGGEFRRLFPHVDVGANLVWRSAYQREGGDPRQPLPASTLLQAHVALSLSKRVTLTLGGSNLLHQTWRSPVDKTLAGVLPDDIPRAGRYVEVGLAARF